MKTIPYYRPFGEPAYALITVNSTRVAGDKVTIDGTDFTLGTHFGDDASAAVVAENLTNTINARPGNQFAANQPLRKYFAQYYGNTVRLIATTPGTAGNSITLTETGVSFGVSGATFAGGTAGTGLATSPASNSSTTATTNAQAYKTVAASGTPEALGSGLVESLTITARKSRTTANTGDVWIGFSATNDTQLRNLAPGESITYVAVDGKKLDLSTFYVDVATNGDGVLYETAN